MEIRHDEEEITIEFDGEYLDIGLTDWCAMSSINFRLSPLEIEQLKTLLTTHN